MNIESGIEITTPSVVIPWEIDIDGFLQAIGEYKTEKINPFTYAIVCTFLIDLRCTLHFQFLPSCDFRLRKLDVYLEKSENSNIGYKLFKKTIKRAWGPIPKYRDNNFQFTYPAFTSNIRSISADAFNNSIEANLSIPALSILKFRPETKKSQLFNKLHYYSFCDGKSGTPIHATIVYCNDEIKLTYYEAIEFIMEEYKTTYEDAQMEIEKTGLFSEKDKFLD